MLLSDHPDPGFRMMSSAGATIVIIAAVVSSVTVGILGAFIASYIWKHRNIQKKRRGKSHSPTKLALQDLK